jgi:FkbM family methyltransferase
MTPNDQRQPRRDLIPEIDRMVEQIRAHPDYWVPSKVTEIYRSLGLTTLPDPFCAEVPDLIAKALREERPYSVIRLGDGEINLLSFGAYDTPHLDRFCAAASIRKRADTFIPNDLWLLALREMMMAAVAQADIVGVVGLWRPRAVDAEAFVAQIGRKLRGYSGHWRGIDYMLRLAREGVLDNKVVASAHLYFGVLEHLDRIFAAAKSVLLVTSYAATAELLRNRFPGTAIDTLLISQPKDEQVPLADSPRFLQSVVAALPDDLGGCCCLVGAGIWAELYCAWIKQRGGVAIDIGSGFDLLCGETSRPVHRALGLNDLNRYALTEQPVAPQGAAESHKAGGDIHVLQRLMDQQVEVLEHETIAACANRRGLRATSGELLETAYVNLCARLAPTLSIEVGAREARFSLRLKKRMPDLHAIAFEANPKTHRTFAESLLQEAASVDYRHAAICDRDGTVALNIPVARNGVRFKRTHGISSLLDRKSPGLDCDTTTVPALRLDTVIAGLDAAKVVAWIDAEGAQREILAGGEHFLEQVLCLYMEVESRPIWEGQALDREIAERLGAYSLVPVMRDSLAATQYNVVYIRATQAIAKQARPSVVNYLAKLRSWVAAETSGEPAP